MIQFIIMKLAPLLLVSFTVKDALAFQIIPNTKNSIKHQQQSVLYSTPNDDDQPQELIIGKNLSEGLQSIGSETGYLAAAKKRNEEAKAKLLEQIRLEEEEAERIRKDRELNGNVNNCGPGDMSTWVGFKNDGFEESEGEDGSAWGERSDIQIAGQEGQQQQGGDDGGETQSLWLGGDEDTTTGSGLIL